MYNKPVTTQYPYENAPEFLHPQQMLNLYKNGLRIDQNLLKEILALPQEDLLSDLGKLLQDARDRYEAFQEMESGYGEDTAEEYHEKYLHFPLHALFLLQEINCDRSLGLVIRFFGNADDDFVDFWMSDHLTETLWQIFYFLGAGRENRLLEFLFQPNVNEFVKSAVLTAFVQMVLHDSGKKAEIENIFERLFQKILDTKSDETIFTSGFNGMAATDYMDIQPNISPLLKQLFDKKYVELMVAGDYKQLLKSGAKFAQREEIFHICELYDYIADTWYGYSDEAKREEMEEAVQMLKAQNAQPKIGRNDPCPCGSGKKYKKCCMGKE